MGQYGEEEEAGVRASMDLRARHGWTRGQALVPTDNPADVLV